MADVDLLAAFDSGFEAFHDPLGDHGSFGFGEAFRIWLHGLSAAAALLEELDLIA
jgi:hypothetical protein